MKGPASLLPVPKKIPCSCCGVRSMATMFCSYTINIGTKGCILTLNEPFFTFFCHIENIFIFLHFAIKKKGLKADK
jgi:hypothetical protein